MALSANAFSQIDDVTARAAFGHRARRERRRIKGFRPQTAVADAACPGPSLA